MQKVILNLDDTGNLTDDNGTLMIGTMGMNYNMPVMDPPEAADPEPPTEATLPELIKLGVSIDDIIKLKANNII